MWSERNVCIVVIFIDSIVFPVTMYSTYWCFTDHAKMSFFYLMTIVVSKVNINVVVVVGNQTEQECGCKCVCCCIRVVYSDDVRRISSLCRLSTVSGTIRGVVARM